jgi:hypothetical protein
LSLGVSFATFTPKKRMTKKDRSIRRRFQELGVVPGRNIKISKHPLGYILSIDKAVYVVGKDGIIHLREILSLNCAI